MASVNTPKGSRKPKLEDFLLLGAGKSKPQTANHMRETFRLFASQHNAKYG